MSQFPKVELMRKLREKITAAIAERFATHYAKHKSAPGQADLFANTDSVATKGGQEKGKWTQTQLGTQEFEKKHPRDNQGQFRKKVGQANLMLWGADGDPTPESQGAPQQSHKISTKDQNKAHDIHVDARAHATHTLQKKLHSLGLAKEAPKHPEPVNTAELKQAAGFGDGEGLLLFRHGNTLRAHGEDAKKLAEVNNGNSHVTADSLEQIGAALKARGHKLAIASKPGSEKQQSLLDAPAAKPAEPPKTPAQEIGQTAGKEIAAKLADKPLPQKSPLTKFLPGKNSEYPKPGEPASNGQTAATQGNPLQPTPVAPPAPPVQPPAPPAQPPAAPPVAPPVQQPAPGPTTAAPGPQLTEAEQERADRAAMELARPSPGAAGDEGEVTPDESDVGVWTGPPPAESKNNISRDELGGLLSDAYTRMFSHAKNIFKGNRDDAEDAVQKAALNIQRFIGKFDPNAGTQFSTWATAIAGNVAKEVIRHRMSLKQGGGNVISANAPTGGDGGEGGKKAEIIDNVADPRTAETPEQREQTALRRKALENVIDRLSPEQQEVLIKYKEGFNSVEIGKMLGKSGSAVRALRDRAAVLINQERNRLTPNDQDDEDEEEEGSLLTKKKAPPKRSPLSQQERGKFGLRPTRPDYNPPVKNSKRESVICQENRTFVQLLIDILRARQAK